MKLKGSVVPPQESKIKPNIAAALLNKFESGAGINAKVESVG